MTQVVVLNVFGGFSLDVSGEAKGAAVPRRLAAVLGILALSGERGVARDRLVHLLWSEADAERSRHALTQSLYSLRRLLGREDIIVGQSHLALDPELTSCDVVELERAIRERDAERVMELYRGEPLEGLAVPGAPEFERWLEEQRTDWSHRVAALLDAAALSAESGGDFALATRVRRRRSALDPLDAVACLALMRSLAAAGDTPAAVQQAKVYGALVRQQLDLEPDPRIDQLAEELLKQRAAATAQEPSFVDRVGLLTRRLPGSSFVARTTAPAREAFASWRRRNAIALPALPREVTRAIQVAGLVLLAALASLAVADRLRGRRTAVPSVGGTVAVMPFRMDAVDSGVAFLRTGIVSLLSDAITERDSAAFVAASSVRQWWDGVGVARDVVSDDSLRRSAGVALEATDVISGSVVGSTRAMVLTAEWRDARTGVALAKATAAGPVDSLMQVIGRLASLLVADRRGAGGELVRGDVSPAALRAWLRGRAAYGRLDYTEAADAFGAALLNDSSFAPAAIGLAMAAEWEDASPQVTAALGIAARGSRALSATAQQQVVAMQTALAPAPRADELFAAWTRVARTGNSATGWVELARRLMKDGRMAGLTGIEPQARAALSEALRHDSADVGARATLAELDGLEMGSLEGVADQVSLPARWWAATESRSTDALQATRSEIASASASAARGIAIRALWSTEALEDGATALSRLRQSTQRPEDALLGVHAYAVRRGDWAAAMDATAGLAELVGNGAHLRLRVLDALHAGGDSAAATEAVPRLMARLRSDFPSDDQAIRRSDLCVVEQWRLSRGDSSNLQASIRQLEQQPVPVPTSPVTAGGMACAALLRATQAVQSRAIGAPDVLLRAEQMSYVGAGAGDLRQYATLALARLRLARGDTARARTLLRRRGGERGWPRYAGAYLELEQRLVAADSARVSP